MLVAVAACGLVLGASALAHLRRPRALARALAVHGVVPPAAWWPLTVAVVAVESVLACALLYVAVLPAGPLAGVGAAAAAALFLAFAVYLAAVLRRAAVGARAPCGCGLGDEPVTAMAVVRAGALAGLAGAVAATAPVEPLLVRPAAEQAVHAAAAVALAAGLARLPALVRLPVSPRRR